MNKRILFSAFIAACVLSGTSQAQTVKLTSFQELKKALEAGQTLKVVIHFANCHAIGADKKTEASPGIVSGFTIGSFDFFPKNSARNSKGFISLASGYMNETLPGKGYMHNFLRLKIFEDGKVAITTSQINPLTFENDSWELYDAQMFNGEMNQAGVYIYDVSQ